MELRPPTCASAGCSRTWRWRYPGEERVEAVDLLPLRDVGVELSDALQGQLLHQVDLVRFLQVLHLHTGHTSTTRVLQAEQSRPVTHHELLDADGERGRVKQDLAVLGQEADDVLDEDHEVLRQQLVCLKRSGGAAVRSTQTEPQHL